MVIGTVVEVLVVIAFVDALVLVVVAVFAVVLVFVVVFVVVAMVVFVVFVVLTVFVVDVVVVDVTDSEHDIMLRSKSYPGKHEQALNPEAVTLHNCMQPPLFTWHGPTRVHVTLFTGI